MSIACHHVFIDFLTEVNLNEVATICCGIISVIFGIAYPIILGTISNVGKSYNSTYLSKVMEFEFLHQKLVKNFSLFEILIVFNILFFFLLIIEFNLIWINNLFSVIAIAVSFCIVIAFMFWIRIVKIYIGEPTYLINRLKNKYYKEIDSTKKNYIIKTIFEFGIHAQAENDTHIDETIRAFLIDELNRKSNE